ncbi:nucleolar protein 9 isoform X2 [Esox lucius]|nr:nucleolar protein 9 isoform X2 [Esox lucius]XP_010887302.2 nucleolar protein 9 isoform X2 [Esox lucius]XP_010887310.2 nucleolar protein 9 isoform X2 [Esox lucius]XP_010887320.2 nucleolar protein 9 isoform X2 [Esox lucius]
MEENNQWRDKGLKRKHPGDQERMSGGRGGGRGGGKRGGSGRGGGERDGVGRGGVKRSGDKERNRGVGNCDAEAKRGGGTGEGGAKKRLDALSVGYFRRVGERLSEGFTEDEERVLFVENVLAEVKGQAALVAMDVTGSVTLQRLLPLASLSQVGEVLAELGGESGSALKTVSCDKCGGHVVESALRQMPRWREKSPLEDQSATTEGEAEDCGVLEPQVLSLCRVMKDHCAEFIRHTHGSHVARTLIHVLAGCLGPARSDTARPGVKDRNVPTQLTYFEVPTSFWWELKHLSTSLMEHVNVCVTDPVASAVLQNMLMVCHRGRPKLCKQLTRGIVGYLTSLSSAPGVSPLLVFLKDAACSRLIETVIQLSHKALLRDLYKNHLKGQLVNLAIHPIANFPIQRLTAASASYKMFLKVFDELTEGLEAILAAGHMGVIVQLTDSCAEWEEKQGEMMQSLLRAFHCAEPASRHTACLPLFLSLLTHDVYYCSETTEGDTLTERPLSSICYHGSRLVQSLAKFKDRSLLLNSLRSLTPADHLTLGTDQTGSHVLQLLVTSSSDKGRGKILRRLEGQYVQMACSRYGSRVLEAIWTSATVPQRQSIAKELVSCENQLRSDQFARHIWAKFALTHFVKRQAQWQEVQMGESKKRKLFSDILD